MPIIATCIHVDPLQWTRDGVVKHSMAQAGRWIVAGVGAALAWVAIVSTPRSKPDESPARRKS